MLQANIRSCLFCILIPLATLGACSEEPAKTAAPEVDVQRLLARGADDATLAAASLDARYTLPDPSLTEYLQGLEHLRTNNFAAAVTSFTASLNQAPDNSARILARAVALLLDEQFDLAKTEILRLPRDNRLAQVWNYAHSTMTGKMHGLPAVPQSMVASYEQNFCGNFGTKVPGHVIQGDRTFSTDFASHVIYEMAKNYGRFRCGLTKDRDEVDRLLGSAGRWYAHMNMARPELLGHQIATSAELLAQGDVQAAATYAGFARLSAQNDPGVHHLLGRIHLQAGQNLSARRAFTRSLALGGSFPQTYIGRAIADLIIGDKTAAQADIEWVEAQDDNLLDEWQGQLDAAARKSTGDNQPNLIRALANATRQRLSEDELTELAQAVHNTYEPRRWRYDEIYHTTRRNLLQSATQNANNPEGWTTLARYIGNEVDLRGESIEKGRAKVAYRYQVSKKQELNTAMRYADKAISVNARYTPALMLRAEILNQLGRADEAEALAQRVLSIDPNNKQAAVLFAMFRAQRATNLRNAAAALRSPDCTSSTTTENRHDGVYEVTRRRCTQPSQSDLNLARQYDRQAEVLQRQSKDIMRRAVDLSRGTYEGFLLQADIHLWQRNFSYAVAAMRKAVELDPTDMRAHEGLIRILPRVGEHRAAADHQIIINRNLQTTAAPLLVLALSHMEKNRHASAGPILEEALTLDPQDARIPTYLGLVYAALNRPDEAEAALQLAMALERARLALDGGATLARPIDEYGLYLSAAAQLAELLQGRQRNQQAVQLIGQTVALTNQFKAGWRSTQMYAGALPGAGTTVPNGATVIAGMQVSLGRHFQQLGQLDTARKHFQQAMDLGPNPDIPNIRSGSGSTNFDGYAGAPVADAMLGLAEVYAAEGRLDLAQETMSIMGYLTQSKSTGMKTAAMSEQLRRAARYREGREVVGERMDDRSMDQYATTLTPHQALAGSWTYTPLPDWRLATPGGTYEFDPQGTYRFAEQGQVTDTGRWGVRGYRQPVEMLTLLSDDGVAYTFYTEQKSADHYLVTEPSSAKFDLKKVGG